MQSMWILHFNMPPISSFQEEEMMPMKILVINPGSTSTKISIFEDSNEVFTQEIAHSKKDLDEFKTVYDQEELREKAILEALSIANVPLFCPTT